MAFHHHTPAERQAMGIGPMQPMQGVPMGQAMDPFMQLVLALQGDNALAFNGSIAPPVMPPSIPGVNTVEPMPGMAGGMLGLTLGALDTGPRREPERRRTPRREPGQTTLRTNLDNPGGRGNNPRSARNSVANLNRR